MTSAGRRPPRLSRSPGEQTTAKCGKEIQWFVSTMSKAWSGPSITEFAARSAWRLTAPDFCGECGRARKTKGKKQLNERSVGRRL